MDQDDGTRVLKREVYEFWSSDLLALFERAGVPRKLPPPFLPAIGSDLLARGGHPPKITLPANEMTLSPDVRQHAGNSASGRNRERREETLLVCRQNIHRRLRSPRSPLLETDARRLSTDRAGRSWPVGIALGDVAVRRFCRVNRSDDKFADISIEERLATRERYARCPANTRSSALPPRPRSTLITRRS